MGMMVETGRREIKRAGPKKLRGIETPRESSDSVLSLDAAAGRSGAGGPMTGEDRRRSALPHRAAAVLVGLFATWQLIYLPGANLIDFVPRRMGPPLEPSDDPYQVRGTFTSCQPLQRGAEWAGDALDFWTEVSGQEQGWSLFAPGLPPYSVFPTVEFRFADGTTDTLASPYEPADKAHPPLRPPLVNNRPFNFESQFNYPVWYAPPEEIAARYTPPRPADGTLPPEYVTYLRTAYRTMQTDARLLRGVVRTWLAWRLKMYRAAHPERGEPVEVVLKHRFVPTSKPEEPCTWTHPVVERPFAKWRPADESYEVYDPVDKLFRPVEVAP
jgi:hypothetical protein